MGFKAQKSTYATGRPKRIAIDHDDYHAKHIGKLGDGRQFFLTQPFRPAGGNDEGCEYVALFLFAADGSLDSATIESFGPRATLDPDKLTSYYNQQLSGLTAPSFERIEVSPFSVTQLGQTFGLITREPEDSDAVWAVELLPGNYMAFFHPWDSGIYDT